jgi:hypothetical protein
MHYTRALALIFALVVVDVWWGEYTSIPALVEKQRIILNRFQVEVI